MFALFAAKGLAAQGFRGCSPSAICEHPYRGVFALFASRKGAHNANEMFALFALFAM